MKLLTNVFNSFYQMIFRIGTGTPWPNFYWQTATLLCENFILKRKLGFIFHLANLGCDTLARQVLDIEVANKLDGIVSQNMEHINKLGFKEVNELSSISKWSFKRLVRKYINKKNESELLNSMKNYKKLDHSEMSQEPYKRKSYFFNMSLEDTRFAFRIS